MADALLLALLPTLIVFGVILLLAIAAVFVVRALRRSPRARAAADEQRALAACAIVQLDAATEELDLEVAFASVQSDPAQSATLRRTRMAAQHARNEAFDDYRALTEAPASVAPPELRRRAERIVERSDQALSDISEAREAHAVWVIDTVDASARVASVRSRFAVVSAELGDPDALVTELAGRVDKIEWAEPAALAARTRDALAEADETITAAEAAARTKNVDPSAPMPDLLTRAEAALRRAQAAASTLDESHRLARQAAAGVAGELVAAREGVRGAEQVCAQLVEPGTDPEPEAAMRLSEAIREAEASIARLEPTAMRRPVTTVNELARVRTRLDLAQDDVRSPRQRLRDARSALPGTLAAARNAIAQAEAVLAANPDACADSRVLLAAASDALADARSRTDPVKSLGDARRAMQHATDATALAGCPEIGCPTPTHAASAHAGA